MAGKNHIEINTRLGVRSIDKDRIIHFPRGLAGFEGLHEFALLQIRPDSPLLILQSIEKEQLGLLVTDPYSFMEEYRLQVSDAEQKILELRDIKQVAVLVTVTVPHGRPELTALNLVGPILVNHEKRLGLQVPQADDTIPTSVLLSELSQAQNDHICQRAQEKQHTKAAQRVRQCVGNKQKGAPCSGHCHKQHSTQCPQCKRRALGSVSK